VKNVISKVGVAVALSQAAYAAPMYLPLSQTVNDSYIGGDDHGWGDVVGSQDKFNTHSVQISIVGTTLTIKVSTNFVKTTGGMGSFTGSTYNYGSGNNPGIAMGDLFLADSWTPYTNTSGPSSTHSTAGNGYLKDNKSNGTDWDYGFSIDANSRKTTGTGSGQWYDLQGDTQNSVVLASDSFLHHATFRNGQAIAVNRSSNHVSGLAGNTTSFTVDQANGLISFSMNIAGTALENSQNIAFRWAMSCGNDAIEGMVTRAVPEPTQLSLLGLGLAALGFMRKRKQQA
jgi:hypothetical protein